VSGYVVELDDLRRLIDDAISDLDFSVLERETR
jgi:6-pyruvoyl-tetrahydropterin synthase